MWEGREEEQELWEELLHLLRAEHKLQGKYARLSLPRGFSQVEGVRQEFNTCGLQMAELNERLTEFARREEAEGRVGTCSNCRYSFSSAQKR